MAKERITATDIHVLAAGLETFSKILTDRGGAYIGVLQSGSDPTVSLNADDFRRLFAGFHLEPRANSVAYPFEAVAVVGRTRFCALILASDVPQWQKDAQAS